MNKKYIREVLEKIAENINKENYDYYPETCIREGFKLGVIKEREKVLELFEDMDLQLMFTDIKDKEGKKIDGSDEFMDLHNIFWGHVSGKLKKAITKEKGCGAELCQVPDVLFCGDLDLHGKPMLCDECIKNKKKGKEVLR